MLNPITRMQKAGATSLKILICAAGLSALLGVPSVSLADDKDNLFQAVKNDNASGVKSLLQRGLDPNSTEGDRAETAMIVALREDSMKVFDVLLNAPGIKLDAHAQNGNTALMMAAYKGNEEAVEALVAKGAKINQPGWTALHYAASVGNNNIVKLFLKKSADINARSPNMTTPLMMAVRGGHMATVKLLLDSGADATLKNELDMTAIEFAKEFNQGAIEKELVRRLKEAGKM